MPTNAYSDITDILVAVQRASDLLAQQAPALTVYLLKDVNARQDTKAVANMLVHMLEASLGIL
jgi:hypothetical protein